MKKKPEAMLLTTTLRKLRDAVKRGRAFLSNGLFQMTACDITNRGMLKFAFYLPLKLTPLMLIREDSFYECN